MGLDPKMLPALYRMQVNAQLYRDKTYGKDRPDNSGLGAPVEQRKPSLAVEHASEVRSVGPSIIRPRIIITMYRVNLLDTDNKWIAPKACLDGIVQAFELPGDSESQIEYRVEQIKVAHRKDQKTVIEIEEIP